MAWLVEDRRAARVAPGEPYLTDAMKQRLSEKYVPRYPNKRAILLPALHYIQHAYNWIPPEAMAEIAAFLDLAAAEVIDTATFYEEYWLRPKGKYLIQVCRSLACEICDSEKLTQVCKDKLNLELGETTPDGRFTLVELECLGACGTAPVAGINEVLYEELTPAALLRLIEALPADPHEYHDESITWREERSGTADEHR